MKAEPGKKPGLKVDLRAREEGAFSTRFPQGEHCTRPGAAAASDPEGRRSPAGEGYGRGLRPPLNPLLVAGMCKGRA